MRNRTLQRFIYKLSLEMLRAAFLLRRLGLLSAGRLILRVSQRARWVALDLSRVRRKS